MQVVVKWSPHATRQLQALTDAQRQSAINLSRQLQGNAFIGEPSYTRPRPDGSEERVYALYGFFVELRYRFKGWIVKRLEIEIIAVSPTPLRSQTEHEEYLRQRRPPHRRGMITPRHDEDDPPNH